MKWRIGIPLVILVGILGYVVYQALSRPAYDVSHTLRGSLAQFAKVLLHERDAEKMSLYCWGKLKAVQQCSDLLADIAARERSQPGFKFTAYSVKAEGGVSGGSQTAAIHLHDAKGNVFLVVECHVTQLPDQSWKITDLTWHPLAEL